MSSAIHHLDWFEEFCQRLESLRQNAPKYADKDEILPADKLYDAVKDNIQDLRELAGFPTLTTPDVWLGPGGEIGVTWDAGDRSFDLGLWQANAHCKSWSSLTMSPRYW